MPKTGILTKACIDEAVVGTNGYTQKKLLKQSRKILNSLSALCNPGEYVTGMFGWQDYAAVEVKVIQRKITETDLPISASLV